MQRPFMLAVAGGSGSGKTTVATAIRDRLGPQAALVDQDAYYRDLSHLPLETRRCMNFDHPDAFDMDLLVAQLSDLMAGRSILKPTYDFTSHTRASVTVEIHPRRVVVVDGLLLLAEARLRELFDLKVFVDVDDDIRFIRRLGRDVTERGRSVDDVIQQYLTTVRPMHREYVEPSKRYADVILSEGGKNRAGVDLILARVERELGRRAGRVRGVSALR